MNITQIKWHQSSVPLVAEGMLVPGGQKTPLMNSLSKLSKQQLTTLRGSHNEDVILVMGVESCLPWIPAAIYLGKNKQAPHLWLPTSLSPSVPVDILDKAVVAKFGTHQFAIDPFQKQLYSLDTLVSLSDLIAEELTQ